MHKQLQHYLNAKITLLLICLSSLYSLPSSVWAAEESLDAENIDASEAQRSENAEVETESAETPSNTIHHLPNLTQKRSQSLIHHLALFERQDEVVQLTSSAEENFYGLFLADMTGTPQGGVLILHDDQQHGHWPDIVAPLREYLPQHGWATLSIELPDRPSRKRIPRQDIIANKTTSPDTNADTEAIDDGIEPIATNEEGEEQLTEDALDNDGPDSAEQAAKLEEDDEAQGDDSLEPALPRLAKLPDVEKEPPTEATPLEEKAIDPIEQYRNQSQQRILAAMDYLRNRGQLNLVIIGYGIGAAWAIDYLYLKNENNEEANDTKGLTLITIDATASRYTLLTMKQQLKNIKIPFLDLIQPQQRYAQKQGKIRQAIMNRNKNENYQQIITTDISSYRDDENPTNRRIRGWLKTNAGGTLVNIKR